MVCVCSYLYQIAHLGDDDDEPEFSSSMPLEEGDTFFFAPRMLKNLVMVDEMDSLSPIMHCQVTSHSGQRAVKRLYVYTSKAAFFADVFAMRVCVCVCVCACVRGACMHACVCAWMAVSAL